MSHRVPAGIGECHFDAVARAIVYLTAEHGVPNSFAPAELVAAGCRVRAQKIGKVARLDIAFVQAQYVSRGGVGIVTYENRRFHVRNP